jgi:hypothetical protein
LKMLRRKKMPQRKSLLRKKPQRKSQPRKKPQRKSQPRKKPQRKRLLKTTLRPTKTSVYTMFGKPA